jgi:hypothetical protein
MTARIAVVVTFLGFYYIWGSRAACVVFGLASLMYTCSVLAELWLNEGTKHKSPNA